MVDIQLCSIHYSFVATGEVSGVEQPASPCDGFIMSVPSAVGDEEGAGTSETCWQVCLLGSSSNMRYWVLLKA